MISHSILQEIDSIKKNVEKELRKKGLVPAKKKSDGTITIGNFLVIKNNDGFYSVKDSNNTIFAERINLPHTAAIFANNLALGQRTNREILDIDRRYGHYAFDEQLCRHFYSKNFHSKNYDKAEILNEKYRAAKLKKNFYKSKILLGFDKLIKIT